MNRISWQRSLDRSETGSQNAHRRLARLAAVIVLLALVCSGATSAEADLYRRPATTCTVVSTADSGAGTLRQCLLDAAPGDTITFDPGVFPPASPATIAITSGPLPDLDDGNVTIDASNAGVILDGSGIGAASDLLLDDVSLTFDGGPNQLANGDFAGDILHWSYQNDPPGVTCSLNTGDYHTASGSLQVHVPAHTHTSTFYDTQARSVDLGGASYALDSTIWIAATPGANATLTWWQKSLAGGNAFFLYKRGDGSWNNLAMVGSGPDGVWGEYTLNGQVPGDGVAVGIQFDAFDPQNSTRGLRITSDGNRIKGLQIVNFPGDGIEINGRANVIGGTAAAERNVVSDNGVDGIRVVGGAAHDNVVTGNLIGTDATGTAARGNKGAGVSIHGGATTTRVSGNTISGNGYGLGIWDSSTMSTTVAGNRIGTDVTGMIAVPNGQGVQINGGTHHNVIGGAAPGEGNLISGNHGNGVGLWNGGTTGNVILGNAIGVDAAGGALPNDNAGIALWDGAAGNTVGPANVIAFNYQPGVAVNGGGTVANTLTQNRIFANSYQGINLYNGGNTELPAPVITAFDLAAGTVSGTACSNCIVEVFSDNAGQGRVYEGTTVADGAGVFAFAKGAALTGPRVTTTATDGAGNTSEFSVATAGVCTVVSTADSGAGTLRQCLLDAAPGDTITFDPGVFPPASPATIAITSGPLPDLDDGNVTVDASNAGVILDGNATPTGANGLNIASAGNLVRGLQIVRFPNYGLYLSGNAQSNVIGGDRAVGTGPLGQGNLISGNGRHGVSILGASAVSNTVTGNFIGVDISGAAAMGNGGDGLIVGGGSYNRIGGSSAGERNVISGNSKNGLRIGDATASDNLVPGNFIGTNASGTAVLGNGDHGVIIADGAHDNVIGGTTANERNLISGNMRAGVIIGVLKTGTAAHHNTVIGNYIGVDPSGTVAWPNGANGVEIRSGARYNRIGGDAAGEGNLISGNGIGDGWDKNGVFIGDPGTGENVVAGNLIGVDATGAVALGNQSSGVMLWFATDHNTIAGNTISGNRGAGVSALNDDVGNVIRDNHIGVNAAGDAALGNGQNGIYLGDGSWDNRAPRETQITGNVISGNAQNGVQIRHDTATNNVISGNVIGLNAARTAALPNGGAGVLLHGGASSNMIGGSAPGAANTIAGNPGDGITLWDATTVNNTFSRNSLYDNDGAAIDLHNGANHNIAPPVVLHSDAGAGTADGTACPGCVVEVFSDAGDEGRWYEGTATANGGGSWSLVTGHPFSGANVRATATNAGGDTSEFNGSPPVVNSVAPGSAGQGASTLVVDIYGDNFREDPPLSADFGAGIAVTSVKWRDPNRVEATINIDPAATLGRRDVTVTNNDGQSGVGTGVFEVLSSSPFGPPAITRVLPEQIAALDQTIRVMILGSGFVNLPAVSVTPGAPGITIGSIYFMGGDRLEVDVHVLPTTPLGPAALTVTNPDGQSATLDPAFAVVAPLFSDVAPAVGLAVSSGEHGAAWGDFDHDGWLDLAIGNGTLFASVGGTAFDDVTAAAGLDAIPHHGGVAWGDYDNDGDLDLLSSWRKVYRQNSLPFTKVFDAGDGMTALAWADYDLDGDLDVYATRRLYRNDGGDAFSDVTDSAGLGIEDWPEWLTGVWADYDADGDPDLYITCNGCPNRLYRNNGDGAFTDVTAAAGVGDGGSGHGAAWGDYDNDGDLDLFVANNNYQYNVLYRNNGDGTFTDVSAAAGFHDRPGYATGANWLDYNLDGWLDVFVVNRSDQNRLYRNNGDGTFTDAAPGAGVADRRDSDGSAVGDYDNDGDPDIFVVSGIWGRGTPNFLFRNGTLGIAAQTSLAMTGGAPHWLKVRLEGVQSNRSGIGARVRVYGGGKMQTRQLAGSTGYMSQDALEALFGLAGNAGPVTVEVIWPSGVVQTLTGVAVDQAILVTEPPMYRHDFAVIAIGQPKGQAAAGSTVTPQATVRNLGAQTETNVPVRLVITTGGSPVYNQVVHVASLGSLLDTPVVFPPYTFPAAGGYLFTFTTLLPGDQNPANDQKQQTVEVSRAWVDIWTKDYPADNGDVPSSSWWQSPDIWVRRSNDGGLIHQDPAAGVVNYVYVRVRNRGNVPAENVTVDTYWHGPAVGIICGDWNFIGAANVASLAPGGAAVVALPWTPTRSGHTCLHDVVYNAADPVTLPCDVPGDNNIEQRNIEILAGPVAARIAGVQSIDTAQFQIANVYPRSAAVDLNVTRDGFPLAGTMVLRLNADLFDRWWGATGGLVDGGAADRASRAITLTDAISATVRGLPLYASEKTTATLELASAQAADFTLQITELIGGEPVGGSVYTGHTCAAADLNCDGHVDTLDLGRATVAWPAHVDGAGYDLWADLDQDGDDDIVDVMQIANGWTGAAAAGLSPAAPDATVLLLDPATATVSVGEAVTLTLQVQAAANLAGWEARLAFDPALVAVEAVTDGGFLASTSRTAGTLGPAAATGQAMLGGYSYGSPNGVSGNGALLQIRLRTLAQGQTSLALSGIQTVVVQNGVMQVQAATGQGGQLTITGPLVAPVVAATRDLSGLKLSWTQSQAGIARYEVYWSLNPYFSPGGADAYKLGEVAAPGQGQPVSYVDSAAFAQPLRNYFYAVRAIGAAAAIGPASNRVGVFHFALTPGAP